MIMASLRNDAGDDGVEPMNVLEYFRIHFPNYDRLNIAIDGESDADVLAEMPLESVCGLDCKGAIDAAVGLVNHVARAYGRPDEGFHHPKTHELTPTVIDAAVQVCICYIRG